MNYCDPKPSIPENEKRLAGLCGPEKNSKNNKIRYERLTRERAARDGEAILALGADDPWENWTVANLLDERPEKWTLSLIATLGTTPVGYVIASRQSGSVHLHHLFVGAPWRNRKIGGELLRRLALLARKGGRAQLTLKVYRQNQRALMFYLRHGFDVLNHEQADLLRLVARVDKVLCKEPDR